MAGCRGEQDADDFVLDETQPLGAAPAVAVLQQHLLSDGPRLDELGLQQLREMGAENILMPGVICGQRVDRGGDPRRIETLVSRRVGLYHNAVHELFGYRTARALSRIIVGCQHGRAVFHPLKAIGFSQLAFRGTYFLIDAMV